MHVDATNQITTFTFPNCSNRKIWKSWYKIALKMIELINMIKHGRCSVAFHWDNEAKKWVKWRNVIHSSLSLSRLLFYFPLQIDTHISYNALLGYQQLQSMHVSKSNKTFRERQHLGRPRSRNANINWVWPFHTVICFMVNCFMPPNFRP